MYISVDIGGTNTRVAGVTILDTPTFIGEPIRRRKSTNYDTDITAIVEAAHKIGGDKIEGVGIGIVGTLNKDKTELVTSNNRPDWVGRQFVNDLNQELRCPVFAENDAVAAALGEAYYGPAEGSFAYVIWGTGMGGVLVQKRSLADVRLTNINNPVNIWEQYFGDWERDCGGKKLATMYSKPPEDLTTHDWQGILENFGAHAKHFVELTRPKAIVFGGGLSVKHKTELVALSGSLGIPCSVTNFDGDSGLYGGLALIRSATRGAATSSR